MIGVGIVGASASRGWALEAHVPALRAHPDFAIAAVATRRIESATAAAEHFGVPHAFATARELAEHPDVDLVAVCVKVPDHVEAVQAALAAGKHVYCEWPLAASTAAAAELAAFAERQRVQHMVGLQGRADPAILHARALVQDGYVGRVLSAVLVGVTSLGGASVPASYAFGVDAAQGMNVLTVPAGHAIDALCFCIGEPVELSARLATRTPRATVAETGEALTVTAPDHVALSAVLESGATVSAHVQGGVPGTPDFRVEILGSEGRLVLHTRSHLQRGDLALLGARNQAAPAALEVPRRDAVPGLSGAPANVARMYDRFAAALAGGERAAPGFDVAVERHRLLAAIVAASERGRRVVL
jgi:predicted dehydrogenase